MLWHPPGSTCKLLNLQLNLACLTEKIEKKEQKYASWASALCYPNFNLTLVVNFGSLLLAADDD